MINVLDLKVRMCDFLLFGIMDSLLFWSLRLVDKILLLFHNTDNAHAFHLDNTDPSLRSMITYTEFFTFESVNLLPRALTNDYEGCPEGRMSPVWMIIIGSELEHGSA